MLNPGPVTPEELKDFAIGIVNEESRFRVEEALLSSQACLMDFLLLKRELEQGSLRVAMTAPSDTLKVRLKRDVAREFGASTARLLRSRRTWRVALPAAAAAIAFAIFANHWLGGDSRSASHSSHAQQSWSVDSAQESAVSLNIF